MPKTKLIIREGDAVVAGIEVDLEQVIGQLVKGARRLWRHRCQHAGNLG